MMQLTTNQCVTIANIFTATADPDKGTRESAERQIQHLYQTDPSFLLALFQFAILPTEELLGLLRGGAISANHQHSPQAARTWQLMCSLQVRNVICGRVFCQTFKLVPSDGVQGERYVLSSSERLSADWRQNRFIHFDTRRAIRSQFLEAVMSASITEKVRQQLLVALEHIIDFEVTSPKKAAIKEQKRKKRGLPPENTETWPELVPSLIAELATIIKAVEQAFGAAFHNPKSTNSDRVALHSILLRLRTCIAVLHLCAKRFASIEDFHELEVEAFHSQMVPTLLEAWRVAVATYDGILAHLAAQHSSDKAGCELALQGFFRSGNSQAEDEELLSDILGPLEEGPGTPNITGFAFPASSCSAALSECHSVVRFCLKALLTAIKVRTPMILCGNDGNSKSVDTSCFVCFMDLLVQSWRQRSELLYGPSFPALPTDMCPAKAATPDAFHGVITVRGALLALSCSPNAAAYQAPAVPLSLAAAFDSPFWRTLKWITKMIHALQSQYGSEKSRGVERRERPIAAMYCSRYAAVLAAAMYSHVQWHHHPAEILDTEPANTGINHYGDNMRAAIPAPDRASLSLWMRNALQENAYSKSLIMAFEVLSAAIASPTIYYSLLLPHYARPILTRYALARLAFSAEDEQLWSDNPEEFVRRQSDVQGQAYDPKVVSTSIIIELCTTSPPQPDENARNAAGRRRGKGSNGGNVAAQQLFFSFLGFIMQCLQEKASAGHATNSRQLLLRTDACLQAMAELRRSMKKVQVPDAELENILVSHVYPELTSPVGYLRAKAIFVLGLFSSRLSGVRMQWSAPEVYQRLLSGVLPLLDDPELPVRMQAAFSLGTLIQHPHAKPLIAPQIAPLIGRYFNMIGEMGNQRVVRSLRQTIRAYASTLAQWAVPLCRFLVDHFGGLYGTVLRRAGEMEQALDEDDGVNAVQDLMSGKHSKPSSPGAPDIHDIISSADELIATMTALVQALPPVLDGPRRAPTEDTALRQVYAGIQATVAPVLSQLLWTANPHYLRLQIGASDDGSSHYATTSFTFIDALLEMLTLLVEKSGTIVVPQLWEVFSGFQGVVLHGGAGDYFTSIIGPMDNMISVDVGGFLQATAWSFLGLLPPEDIGRKLYHGIHQDASDAVAGPIQAFPKASLMRLLADMCTHVLLKPNHLLNSELVAVPKIIESVLVAVMMVLKGARQVNATALAAEGQYAPIRPPSGVSAPVTPEHADSAIRLFLPIIIKSTMMRPNLSPTLLCYLHSNVLLMLVISPSTCLALMLHCGLPPATFFQNFGQLSQSLLSENKLQMRQLHIIACCYSRLAALSSDDTVAGAVQTLGLLLQQVLFRAREQLSNMLEELKRMAQKGAGEDKNNNSDSEDYIDDDDGEEDEEEDEDEDEDGEMFADETGSPPPTLRGMAQKAARARRKNATGMDDAALDDDDDDDEEFEDIDDEDGSIKAAEVQDYSENVLEDFDGHSDIEDVNVWHDLCATLSAQGIGAAPELAGAANGIAQLFEEFTAAKTAVGV